MSETKHTPGPWRVIARANERNGPCVQRGRQGGFMIIGMSPEAEDADARLIAAAPELLEALESQISEHYATWMAARADAEGAPTSHALFEQEPSTIKARAAIAKATGAITSA